MNLNSLHTFAPNTKEQWLKAIEKELGEKSLESLDWTPDTGITMSPYYTSNPQRTVDQQGVFPFEIHQTLVESDAKLANATALKCLAGGAQSIGFSSVQDNTSLEELCKDIEWPFIQLTLNRWPLTIAHHQKLLNYTQSRGWQTTALRGCLGHDANILWSDDLDLKILRSYQLNFASCRLFVIDGIAMADAGASVIQQIAGILAVAQETLHRLIELGMSIDEASAMLQINVRIGTSYFVEMTKLKVIRALYAQLAAAYYPQFECSKCIFIHASTGGKYYASSDTNTNLLRATTSAMSAVLGQASSIEVAPHDHAVDLHDALRWARNTLHVLREESYFDQAIHATQGSYYIEEMHTQMAEAAWQMFVDMEEKGGWKKSETSWKAAVQLHRDTEQHAIALGSKIVVGVNKYQAK